MALVAGIDIGSTTTKVALMDDGEVLCAEVAATGVNAKRTVEGLLAQALAAAGRSADDVDFVATTGYGRRMIPFADHVLSEIAANAKGAAFLAQGQAAVRTILDVGGQDSKVIALDAQGMVRDFAMNDKCAAGTGRFLELIARVLEVEVDAMGELSLQATAPCTINSLCAVFAESEVVSLLAEGAAVPDILAGIHASIAKRMAALVRRVGVAPAVFFDGGAALNVGLAQAMETELGVELVVPDRAQVATAIGAAFAAAEQHAKRGRGMGVGAIAPQP